MWAPHAASAQSQQATQPHPDAQVARHQATINQYCVSCHSEQLRTAELSVEGLDLSRAADKSDIWE